MNNLEILESETNSLYVEWVTKKSRVLSRRISKFRRNGDAIQRRRHWVNHTGKYRDPIAQRGPKFYRSQRPVRDYISIRTYGDLMEAIKAISSGEANHDHYQGADSLTRERLRVAQSLRDRGIAYKHSFIARAGYNQLKLMGNGGRK